MAKSKTPVTPGIRFLKSKKVAFSPHCYKYEENGGAKVAAKSLGVDEHLVVKTIVMEDAEKNTFFILMHGNKSVSTKNLARALHTKSVQLCSPKNVTKITGYLVGGTSPFGSQKTLPVYIEASILKLKKVWINAGKRGVLVEITTDDLVKLLKPISVNVAISE